MCLSGQFKGNAHAQRGMPNKIIVKSSYRTNSHFVYDLLACMHVSVYNYYVCFPEHDTVVLTV